MINYLSKRKKLPSMSLVEYWYLSLKKDINLKKSDKSFSRKILLSKKKKLNKKILLNLKNKNSDILRNRMKLLSINNLILYRSFKRWFFKKYKKLMKYRLNVRFLRYFIIKKYKKFQKKFFKRKYRVSINLLKKQNKIKILNRIVYLNLLFLFSKFLFLYKKLVILKKKFKSKKFNFRFFYNFLLYKNFKNFKIMKLKFLKSNRYLKWWYFLRLNYLKNNYFLDNLWIKKSYKLQNINLSFRKNKLNSFFCKFIINFKKENKFHYSYLINLLYNLKKRDKIHYFYFWSIIKYKINKLKNNLYLIYNLFIYLFNLSTQELIQFYNIIKLNSLNYNFIINKVKKITVIKNYNLNFHKKLSILSLRISKNKLLKMSLNINKNLLLFKNKFKYYKLIFKYYNSLKINFNYLKLKKIYSYRFKLLQNTNNLINNLNIDSTENLNYLFLNTTNSFENKVNYYYYYLLNLFSEFKLQNKFNIDINHFINKMIYFLNMNHFENKLKSLIKFILLDKNKINLLYFLFIKDGILYKFYLKFIVKTFLMKFFINLKKIGLKKFYLDKICNKINWKRNINFMKTIKKNIFNFNIFFLNYLSFNNFMVHEKLNLIEGFYKIKNLFIKYNMVNPAKTLILSDTVDRKFFCFIWNVWESYYFYKDLLIDLLKKDYLLNIKCQTNDYNIGLRKSKIFNSNKIFYKNELKMQIKKVWSRLVLRKKFPFFNLLLFWYLQFYNKIFLFIKFVLFRLWIYYYFIFNKSILSFYKIFKINFKNFPWLDTLNFTIINKNYFNLLQKIKFTKNFKFNFLYFNPFWQENYIDYYRSNNLYNDFFFKSVLKSSIIHLGYILFITIKKTEKQFEKPSKTVFFKYNKI